MQGSRRSQLRNPWRSPDFTVFTELYKQPKVASFSFLGSLVTQSCNLLAVAMEMARESWLIRSEEFVPFWSRYLYKSSIRIIYENWATVPYGSCKCCCLNWLKSMKMTPLILFFLYRSGGSFEVTVLSLCAMQFSGFSLPFSFLLFLCTWVVFLFWPFHCEHI